MLYVSPEIDIAFVCNEENELHFQCHMLAHFDLTYLVISYTQGQKGVENSRKTASLFEFVFHIVAPTTAQH